MLPNPNPLSRIFNTLLLHALRDGARAIRLESGEIESSEIRMDDARALNLDSSSRATQVEFLVGHEWRRQLQIPGYVFAPLTAHIEAMQNAPGKLQLRFVESEFGLGLDFFLRFEKSVTAQGERLEISLIRLDFEGNYDSQTR